MWDVTCAGCRHGKHLHTAMEPQRGGMGAGINPGPCRVCGCDCPGHVRECGKLWDAPGGTIGCCSKARGHDGKCGD